MNTRELDRRLAMTTGAAALACSFQDKQHEKHSRLLVGLNALCQFHYERCIEYRRILDAIGAGRQDAPSLSDLPWLPVRLFKHLSLRSVSQSEVVRTLVSSGTSGEVSRIYLDAETARTQTRALAAIVLDFVGGKRLPMVIVDDQSFLKDRSKFNARAAGILGFSSFGRDHFYLLDEQLRPRWGELLSYIEQRSGTPILVFGFTFLVWQTLVEDARAKGLKLSFPPGSLLIHGGGWKRLEDRCVSPKVFKEALMDQAGMTRVHNYYGMVEQVGAIYFECEHGHLHAPGFADVLVRNSRTLEPLPHGEPGLIQVMSLLPTSYPGHSLLTEDIGTVEGEDQCPCGRAGKVIAIHGRLANVELRGCSDTRNTTPMGA